jgi:hypothetical protein
MSDPSITLGQLWSDAKQQLLRAVESSKADFHIASLATIRSADSRQSQYEPTVRSVVLRGVRMPSETALKRGGTDALHWAKASDVRQTIDLAAAEAAIATPLGVGCHTDLRSEKVSDTQANPRAAWCFYSAKHRLQVRMTGPVVLHKNDVLADAAWAGSSVSSRRCYLAQRPPGAACDQPSSNLPSEFEQRNPTAEESEAGRQNFAVFWCDVDRVDILKLDADGHRRGLWQRDADGHWSADWIEV